MLKNDLFLIEELISKFEQNKLESKSVKEQSGVVYTPQKIADYIVKNVFKFFFNDFLKKHIKIDQGKIFPDYLDLNRLKELLNANVKEILKNKLKNLKILDPACGSGRFLIAIANYLLELNLLIDDKNEEFEIRNQIIKNNIYGIEIDRSAYLISKLRLLVWLNTNNYSKVDVHEHHRKKLEIKDIELLIKRNPIDFNLYNVDFLFEFDLEEISDFDFIIGNPPYIENKKIKDIEFKKRIYKRFKSAYKLFDLSIIFLEKSLEIMKNNDESYLSFIIPNKFLSADYGVKIRSLLLSQTELKEINNISSLNIFSKAATYPVIISLKKCVSNEDSKVIIKNYNDIDDFLNLDSIQSDLLPQSLIKILPSNVIPISGDIKAIQYIYTNFKTLSDTFDDLKIIYRPFGFLEWADHFKNINERKDSNQDLILLGTGNVGKYYIKFQKRIKIAKQDFKVSYFKKSIEYNEIWHELNKEKILFREIAKELTCVYDPGIFVNITGLYSIKIPSLNTQGLYSFLTVMNSELVNRVFNTLFGTLHMSGGYMRFNGSFIKRLPMPKEFPNSLNYLGRINQFLSQLIYDYNSGFFKDKEINITEIGKYSNFFKELTNSLVELLFLKDFDDNDNQNHASLKKILYSNNIFPEIQVKYNNTNFSLPKFEIYQQKERTDNINKITALFNILK